MTTKRYLSHSGTSALLTFRLRYLVLLLAIIYSYTGSLQAQCSFDEAYTIGEQRTTGDFDGACGVFVPNVGCLFFDVGNASISLTLPTGLPAATMVTTPMIINLCFAGDIDVETLTVNISGLSFQVGNLGYSPNFVNTRYCRDFVIPAGTVMTGLGDGDIDITVTPFGGGWTTDPSTDGTDFYGVEALSVNFGYDFDVSITPLGPVNNPATPENESILVRCAADADINFNSGFPGATFTINPVPSMGFSTVSGLMDVSAIPPGLYNVNATFASPNCSINSPIVQVRVLPEGNVALKPTLINCAMEMDSINLSVMFDGANLEGGSFSVESGPAATINGDFLLIPPGGGCLGIQYTATDSICNNTTRISNTAELLILMAPAPDFDIGGYATPICNAGGTETITLTDASNGPNQILSIRSTTGLVNGASAATTTAINFGAVTLSGPASQGSNSYIICLTEQNDAPTDCATTFPTDDPNTADTDESIISTCSETSCQRVTIFNDGNGCAPNAFFTSECEPDIDATDVCAVSEKNNLALSCSFFTLNGPQLIEAELTNYPDLIFCSDETFDLDWQGSLPGSFGDVATGGPTLGDINPAAGVICDIITFEICIPLPIVDDFCLDPIPLGPFEDACDQTIGQIIFENLSTLIGGDGGSGIVVADTDGDGAFDYIVEDYTFPANGTNTIPNNIVGNTGTITVRNVTAWPFNASDVCGDITTESINLLELLPIGAIPLVGIIIEDLLAAASCNVDLVFTDAETIEIPVYNNSTPEFANCPENGYVITEDGVCDTEANWSIPTAYDGCGGTALQYKGFTDYPEATMNFNGPSTPTPVAVASSGVYQTAGPLPGSDLEPGTYTIAYTAYSCSGIVGICTFEVLVTSGDPVLACPAAMELKVDGDLCSTVVTGLAPLQGISCATVINYNIAFADGTTAVTTTPYSLANRGTHNDASGQEFPFGTSTVTYTMEVDINGDGVVADDGLETQTCDFTVTILDTQRPIAECIDVEVRLDNTGSAIVFADSTAALFADMLDETAFLDGGSTDNCGITSILIAKPGDTPTASIMFDCTETGYNLVTLSVTDNSNNVTTCISQIKVDDFFEGISFDLDAPEICLEANNPSQLDFANYLIVTLPDATILSHGQVANNAYLGDAVGGFGISAFAPAPGSASNNPGSISTDGIYTPGDGSGFVTVSYVLALPGAVMQNGNVALTGCVEIVHSTFELRQPLDMVSPECECIVQNDRIVNLGEVSGGLEPYTIQFSGVQLDVDNDQIADDVDGSFTYDGSFIGSAGTVTNYDIDNFTEDLGNLLVDYTQPTWSFTIIDARGCEIFRSGSCDNDDDNNGDGDATPIIDCTALGAVTIYTRNEPACEVQDTWTHTLPTDNCDVILYTYTIENPDGSIAGPFDLTALLNPDITTPLADQFYGEYDFEHNSPTENVSTVTYYAEDAVGNFTQCEFTVTVIDDDAPYFINCPEPAVIVDAPELWCAAFANYSLPLAADNCAAPVVTQVDDTGLTSGDLYPVGITINTFEAVDATGNTTRCDVKIIVNDYHTPPTIVCPDDVVAVNDEGDCGAIVSNIAPSGITDNCPDNLTVVYRIDDADGNELSSGFDDASGSFFDLGLSTVSYSVQDMPLLLITEVTHEFSNTVDGGPVTAPTCFDGILNGDETGVDCGGSSCVACNCTNNEVTVEISLDGIPEQTTWTITEPNDGAVLAAGGPYAAGLAGTTVSENICLPDGCYDFVIRDTNLDGIALGGGSYLVSTGTGVLASGGEFGAREVTNFCLDGTPAATSLTGTAGSRDAFEITNFGSANLDVSCLMIERLYAGGSETYAVPTGAILAPGGVLTIHFGDGHNDLANNIFNVPGATDLAITDPAAYIISLSRSILDVVVLNDFDISGLAPPAYNLGGLTVADYWSGSVGPVNGAGIVRTTVWDTDSAADFAPGEACLPVTIGLLNPGLAQPTPNGASTAIQAQPTVRVECDFTVTISDDEDAVCGLYGEWNDYVSGAIDVAYGECIETVYTVGDAYTVSDVNLNLQGFAGNMGNLTFTLISPEGTEVVLAVAECGGIDEVEFTFDGDFGPTINFGCAILNNAGDLVMPVGDIEIFNGEAAAGDWILQIGHNGQASTAPAAFASTILSISSREDYPDYTTTLENDLGVCGADYTWNHAILFDNCPGGTILWTIVYSDGTTLLTQALPIFPENTEVTFFFPVGVATVTYALTDGNGNTSSCSFDVTVNDTEDPVITCPSDVVIQLEGGDCEEAYTPTDYTATDNCGVVSIFGTPPFSEELPIGVNPIDFTVTDAAGNDTTCTYLVTILEYIPANPQMACLDQINIHLGSDCEQVIIPSMVLAGNEYYCFDNYVITLLQQNEEGMFDTITPNVVGIDQIGGVVRYQVYDPRNDVSCWGNIDVGFFEAPEFICPADTTVNCNADTDVELMGSPILLSCALAEATVVYADTLQRNDACDDPRAILRRTWKVTDAYGNSGSCVQTITIQAFDLATVLFPADLDGENTPAINCAAAANDPTLTDPENTGFPFVENGGNIFTENFCNTSYLYTDEVYSICAGSFEIVRTWKVRNTCQPIIPGVNPVEAVQIIRVLDFENPQLTCPDDVTVSTNGIDCNGGYSIPEPVVETSCTNYTYTVSVSSGDLIQANDGTYVVFGLEVGVHTIRYEVEDECGRYSECIFNLTVTDQVGPTASCEDGLNVSIVGGEVSLFAEDIDGNSQDVCGAVELEIRRTYTFDPLSCESLSTPIVTDWAEAVSLTCCDLQEVVTVELRVTDDNGNQSTCWTEILVEDKIAPVCNAPANLTITCSEYNERFPNDIMEVDSTELDAAFGIAFAVDNCGATVTQSVSANINNCGVGQITRMFTATDGSGLTNITECIQVINIVRVADYQIAFPTDESGTCAEIPGYEELFTESFSCDLFTLNTQVDTIETTLAGDECFSLRITYDVINFCEYNSLGEAYLIPRDGRTGRDPETELLYLNVIPGVLPYDRTDDIAFLSRFSDRNYDAAGTQQDRLVDDGNDNDGSDDDNDTVEDLEYGIDDSRGFFSYIQYIKVYDDVAPVVTTTEPTECFSGQGDECSAYVELNFTATDDCSEPLVTALLDLNYIVANGFQATRTLSATELIVNFSGGYVIRLEGVPAGQHAVRINANDGCGNFDNAIIEFCVSPDLAPTPICIQTLTVTLMPDGQGGAMASIWANDFVASPIIDCFGNTIDIYSLYTDAEAGNPGFTAEVDHPGVEFTCADFITGEVALRLYAFDAAGNSDFCQVVVDVQLSGNGDLCDDGSAANLAGAIMDLGSNAVEGVTIELNSSSELTQELVTTEDGLFQFTELPLGDDYTVVPTHYSEYLNGVRTSDIVSINRHILGASLLEGPYIRLAADVNGDNNVNVGDIISIRRLILGLDDVFPNDRPSWIFVPADFEFSQSDNPWSEAFPNVGNFNDLGTNVFNADFIGVKLGDVDQSALANAQAPGVPRSLNGSLEMEVDEVQMLRGETYRVPVKAADLKEVDGYQFTLEFDREVLDVTGIEPGLIATGNFGWAMAERGLITSSWNWGSTAVPADWTGEEVLFTLLVRANSNETLSSGIMLGSRYTVAEAYQRNADNLLDLALVFNETSISDLRNELFQNTPNPVRDQTVIGFQLVTAQQEVVVSIRDAAGRIVREFRQEGSAGYNSIVLDNGVFNRVAGVYSYTVTAGDWVATKRMIVMK